MRQPFAFDAFKPLSVQPAFNEMISSYGAAIDAVVVVDCKIAVTWMRLDHSELHWLAAPRAGVIDEYGQRHGQSFSPPAN